MKIATLNTWGTRGPGERQAVVLEALRALGADLLLLQEVTDPKRFGSLPYPTRLHAPLSGLSLLSRLPLAAEIPSRVVTYETRSALEPYAREAFLAPLKVGSKLLWVVTTHLAWQQADEPTRLAQVEELLRLTSGLGENLLFSGDFNAEPLSPPIRRILQAGFLDLFPVAHPNNPGITWDNQNPFIQGHSVKFPDRRIDYLFLHRKAIQWMKLESCQVICRAPTPEGLYPSDHYGVLADFKIEGLR